MIKNILILLFIGLFAFTISCDNYKRADRNSQKGKNNNGKYVFNKDGDSVRINYYPNGFIKSSITIKNRRKNGIAYLHYENGKIQFEIMYNDGFKHGLVKYFYESGKIYRETTYINGQIDGTQRIYYENGKLKAEIPYHLGQVQMGTKEFYSSGKEVTKYPVIKVVPIDKMALENKYYLKIYLIPKKTKVRYYIHKNLKGGVEGKIDLDPWIKNGVATYPINIFPGESKMEKIDIRAEFKTRKGNPKVIRKVYNLAVENRSFY